MENACNRQSLVCNTLFFLVPTLQTLPFTFAAGNILASQMQPEAGIPSWTPCYVAEHMVWMQLAGVGETSLLPRLVPGGMALPLLELRPAELDKEHKHHIVIVTNQAGTWVGSGKTPAGVFRMMPQNLHASLFAAAGGMCPLLFSLIKLCCTFWQVSSQEEKQL